ncbi:MAG: hypothetical protein QGF20_10480 [Alphaproteobacteria bacterium]|nr:hypothetical protein [Alphaproteobacteria bacterium]
MPLTKLHRQRLGRNLAVAGILIVFIVAAFVITMFGMQGQTWSPN